MSIELKNIEVFPSTKTTTMNKLITENSLTRLVNRLLDVDGYIISSEFNKDTVSVTSDYNHVVISDLMLQEQLEISLRGYYFDLGDYDTILKAVGSEYPSSADGDFISAVIFVDDTSNPEYPEIYGYNYEEITDTVSASYTVPAEYRTTSYRFILFDSDNKPLEVKVAGIDSDGILIDSEGQAIDFEEVGASTVRYIVQSSKECIQLYSSADTEPETPDGCTAYKLVLFEKVEGNWVIPVSSFHKFGSISLQDIDGGKIKLPTETEE